MQEEIKEKIDYMNLKKKTFTKNSCIFDKQYLLVTEASEMMEGFFHCQNSCNVKLSSRQGIVMTNTLFMHDSFSYDHCFIVN